MNIKLQHNGNYSKKYFSSIKFYNSCTLNTEIK